MGATNSTAAIDAEKSLRVESKCQIFEIDYLPNCWSAI